MDPFTAAFLFIGFGIALGLGLACLMSEAERRR